MAKTGEKRLTFPFSLDLLDALQKFKKKVTYVNFTLSAKRDKIEIHLRGSRDNVTRAIHELRQIYTF